MRYPVGTLALLLTVIASGCSLFGSEDTTIEATGRVVLAGTGEPLGGLGVTLSENSTVGAIVRASVRTDAEGAFRITFEPGHITYPLDLTINDEPYDPRYRVTGGILLRGEHRDFGTVELGLNGTP